MPALEKTQKSPPASTIFLGKKRQRALFRYELATKEIPEGERVKENLRFYYRTKPVSLVCPSGTKNCMWRRIRFCIVSPKKASSYTAVETSIFPSQDSVKYVGEQRAKRDPLALKAQQT